jgi:hypothetical protein
LTIVFVGLLWVLVGWALLNWAGFSDPLELALLSPVTGLVLACVVVSTFSVVGVPIRASAWWIAGALASLALARLWIVRDSTSGRHGLAVLLVSLVVAALSVASVGQGLITIGSSWQGLVNEDGATNALGAQYFLNYPFFAHLDPAAVISGRDYSPLVSALYVESGHRFGDVMMLALSAALTSQHPDQVYMAHGMMLRVAMILACTALIYRGRESVFSVGAALILLTISSLGGYIYLNQLISQTGGVAFMALAMIVWLRLCGAVKIGAPLKRTLLLLALILTGLLRYYPEIASVLALAMLMSVLLAAEGNALRYGRRIFVVSLALLASTIVMSNFTLPHTYVYVLDSLVKQRGDFLGRRVFDYAFTPDVLPMVFGFIRMRESIADPWATALIVGAFALALCAVAALWMRRGTYLALFGVTASLLTAFGALWAKGEDFGTFKSMLLLQPFVLLVATVVLAAGVKHPRAALSTLVLIFCALNLRVTIPVVSAATSDGFPVPGLAKAKLLDTVGALTSGSFVTHVDLQSDLPQRYLLLRANVGGMIFESDPQRAVWNYAYPPTLKSYHQAINGAWVEEQFRFRAGVNAHIDAQVRDAKFGCGVEPMFGATFKQREDNKQMDGHLVLAGGQMQTFNRVQFGDKHLVVVDRSETKSMVVQRESSLGSWEVRAGPLSVLQGEPDPMLRGSNMAAVGRYLLLEIVGRSEQQVQLRMQFTRSFFGVKGALLPTVRIQGESAVELGGFGAGAMDIVTAPVMPCNVGGRRYVMIDFGSDLQSFDNAPPFAYRVLGVRYSPDTRKIAGFLRDVSIVASADEPTPTNVTWSAARAPYLLGYSGIFEDGWISNDARIDLKVADGRSRARFSLELDATLMKRQAHLPIVVVTDNLGNELLRQTLAVGANILDIKVPSNVRTQLRLTTNRSFALPGDGRLVSGRLVSVDVE